MSTLFGDEALSVVTTAKFTVLEAFLTLLPRACKFSEFTREILLTMMRVVKSEAGSLFEVDHTNNNLFFRAVVGQSSDKVSRFKIPLGQGVVGHVAESKQAVVVANALEDRKHLRSIGNAVGFEARNLVAIPILIRGRVFGVVELLNRIGDEGFTASDVEMLSYACEMAAKTIEVRLMLNWSRNRAEGTKPSGDAESESVA
jgi:two-component system, cell cycle response regulator